MIRQTANGTVDAVDAPWQLLPVVGPAGMAIIIVLTVIVGVYRALENSRLQTAKQVEVQLAAKDAVIELQRETIELNRATLNDLMEHARFSTDALKAIRTSVERWE